MRSKLLFTLTAAALSVGLASPALAAPTTVPTEAGAGWLATQLVDGDRLQSSGYDDAGLTIDAILAFDATGVAGDAAKQATTWLATPEVVNGYIGDGQAESYAGAHAKLALLALAQGQDPEDFGGRALLTELVALQDDSGRFSDKSQWGNFSNSLGQSLAVIALDRGTQNAPVAELTAAAKDGARFLVDSQCADGSFPQDFGGQTCIGSVDATGLVVQALLISDHAAEATAALDWLAKQQQGNGGFGPGSTVDAEHPVNANSTGSALLALRAGAREEAADKAAAYLVGLQIDCAGPAEQRGAISYAGTFDAGTAPRATAGALLGLAGVPLPEITSTGITAAAPALDCAAAPTTPAESADLPVTGAAVAVLVAIGAAMLAVGAGLMAVMRRRRRV